MDFNQTAFGLDLTAHTKTVAGKALWKAYILKEAQICVNAELSTCGASKKGNYYSSSTIDDNFFDKDTKAKREEKLNKTNMPFLYTLIYNKLQDGRKINEDQDDSHSDHSDDSEEEFHFNPAASPTVECSRDQIVKAPKTMVLMIAFGQNRRCNAFQTGHKALASLGRQAKEKLSSALLVEALYPLSPFICIDNINFAEKKHSISPENTTRMFHGTWGYVHVINKRLVEGFDPEDFSVPQYKEALQNAAHAKIEPTMFIPTFQENLHFSKVIKSQLARVLMGYVVIYTNNKSPIPLDLPPITPIEAQKPNIHMLKLMRASNNLAEGIGQVLSDIIRQTSLTEEQYHSKLQILEGDLGTVLNLESLRAQRKPSGHVETSLGNTFMLLEDLGAWSTLEALGLPSDRPLGKNDFTQMITNIQKIHEVTLIHCLLLNASKKAAKFSSPKLRNLLLRLRDFATIIEANRSMKAGNIGRLMNIWRCWAVMAQGIKGLNHYGIHLPRMLLLINHFLSPGMRYLQQLVQSIEEESGATSYYQSHKHVISIQTINAFLQMAVSKSIHNGASFAMGIIHKPVNDIMSLGILAMQNNSLSGGTMLKRFNPSTNLLTPSFEDHQAEDKISDVIMDPDNELHISMGAIE
ncbi:hypothetical protein PCASD_18831 [Puccinia coronata f. sp. avenae]|uniref:DUF6589 domain-containing protein n=1 Tax=Puccinia coronata f. sp. avenae TaxID=200324 RepID=A0A2N5SG59_9BASI|nr:hypothetical protein PCASD_18831 [Puccinia coronata f. sp. avenae]